MAGQGGLAAGTVSSKDIRRCKYFLRYLSQNGATTPPGNTSTASGCCSIINTALHKKFMRGDHQGDERRLFVLKMEQRCSEDLIDVSSFDWLQSDGRACFYAWGYLRTVSDQGLGFLQQNPQPSLFYDKLGLAQAPSSTKERFDIIVDFFDIWDAQVSFKLESLQLMKSNWINIFKGIKPFKWLDKGNESQCKWAIIYLQKADIPLWFLQPVDNAELYHAIIAAYDLWQEHPDTKKLFHINISKAWSQKKHRDSLVGKKPLNTYLKEETKQKLDALSAHHDKKIHEMLERIIREEYERAFN